MEQGQFELQDYLAILRRRIWALVIPVALLLAIAVPIIFALPPTYQSKATILIEDQAIPRDLVQSTVSTFAAERLEIITQRVMATQNLVQLVNKLDLYRDLRNEETMTELAERMRKAFSMKLKEANVTDARSGRSQKATIAFTLSFEHTKPAKAQAVVQELVSLYISENLRTRRAKAEETKNFLQQEVEKAASQISLFERALAEFKQRNAGNLPEQIDVTMAGLRRAEQQIMALQSRVGVLRERKIYLEAQLIQVDPYLRAQTTGNKTELRPEDRLRQLRAELLRLRARYGAQHPDVRRVVRQIAVLSQELKKNPSAAEKAALAKRELASAQAELKAAQQKYSDAHPDVVRLRRRIAALEKTIRQTDDDGPTKAADAPNNPAYIKLKADLAATDTEIKSLKNQEKALRKRIAQLERQVTKAPQVEREYMLLKRKLEFAIKTHADMSAKLRQARLGEALELERKAERFSLLEPASLPREPNSPNRPAYVLVAFIFALSLGAASAAGFEVTDKSIHSPKQLAALTGAAPLVVLPDIVSAKQARWRRRQRVAALAFILLVAMVAAYLVFVAEILGPVDILQARLEQKIGPWLRDLGLR